MKTCCYTHLQQHVLVLHVVRAEGLLPEILHTGVQASIAGDLEEAGVKILPEPIGAEDGG